MQVGLDPLHITYISLFAVTALTCFGVIPRARKRLDDRDTRWGLTALLGLCGFWAAFHVGRLIVPTRNLKITFYILGLIVGLATVGAWLQFCSAYAGETYHRQSFFRITAALIFTTIAVVKVTSPIHGLYFTVTHVATPFPHLDFRLGVFHWIVTGLAYSLSAIGFYILFDAFRESGYATTRLGLLVSLAGLPVIFNVITYLDQDTSIFFSYEPIGVGLFALGVLYVADGTFIGVRAFGREQLLDDLEASIILLDRDEIIRDVNTSAYHLFPGLSSSAGKPLNKVAPEILDYLPVNDTQKISMTGGDEERYYLLSAPEITAGKMVIGQALVFTEVTEFERQRSQIKRQQSRMDDLASAITHELRNTLNVTQGNIDLAQTRVIEGENQSGLENLETAARMTERMTTLVSDLATLARFGQRVKSRNTIDVRRVSEGAFESIACQECELSIDTQTIEADELRLETLFERLFSFSIANGATKITVEQSDGEITVTDDGRAIESEGIEAAFTYGQAVPDSETGMMLPLARTLVEAHGWEITIDPSYRDGVRIVITT